MGSKLEIIPISLALIGNALVDEIALKFIFTILGMVIGTIFSFFIRKFLNDNFK